MNHQKINNQKHTANTALISTVALGTALVAGVGATQVAHADTVTTNPHTKITQATHQFKLLLIM